MTKELKLSQLKQQAYRLAGVTTTGALKQKHEALSRLDMRYKASWERVIDVLENVAQGIPVWDGKADSVDATIHNLLDYQAQLMEDACEIGLNQISINQEFNLD
jgi:prophage DNA circulation protein